MTQTVMIGPVTLHIYGVILGVAIAAGFGYAEKMVARVGLGGKNFEKLAWITLASGIVGARLYHVVDYWWYYQNHLNEALAVWNGGLGIWGAVVGGVIGLLISNLKLQISNKNQNSNDKRKSLWILLDAGAAALPLGQAIGRWGNYVNNELYGKPTNLPWKMWIPVANRLEGYENIAFYHPVFLYESLLNLGLFLGLVIMLKRGWKVGSGKFLGGYLVGYGLIRSMLEPLKIDPWRVGGLYTAQWFGLMAIVTGLWLLTYRRKRIK